MKEEIPQDIAKMMIDLKAMTRWAMEPPKMPTIDHRDKKNWGDGPWENEPDRLEFKSPEGFDCLITRVEGSGHLCGYVGVPEGHPAYGKHYDEVDVSAHGGLTYARECEGHVCHKTDEGSPEVWWLGFDCAHGGDICPATEALMKSMGRPSFHHSGIFGEPTYKDIEFVKSEILDLSSQLHQMSEASQPS